MSHRNLNVLSVVLLLAGCGGGDFSTAGLEPTDGTGGAVEADAGAAGATQGTGGVTGVTGGQAAVTGGSAATGGDSGGTAGGGTGGQQAGSGGGPGATGGAATGGQQPATGGASGGSGAGGAGGTCKPPRLMPEDLPQTFVWDSWSAAYGSTCVTCQQSPCTTCSAVAWWPVDQSADGLTVTAKAVGSQCSPVAINVSACGSAPSGSSCTTWDVESVTVTYTFQLKPKPDGTGYAVVVRDQGSTTGAINDTQGLGSCTHPFPSSTGEAISSVSVALRDTLAVAEWPCGQ